MRAIRRLENRLTNVSCPNYLIPSIAFVSKKIFKSKKVILDPVQHNSKPYYISKFERGYAL